MGWISQLTMWRLGAAALCAWLAACSPERSAASAIVASGSPAVPTQRDSAGVAILEYPAGVAERVPQLTVDTNPIAVIGDDLDGGDDVTHVYGPVLLSDGAVAFWDDARGQIAVYEADGTERRRIGRRGQGPGEFESMSRLVQLGDTLIAADDGNDRITLYSAHLDPLSVTRGARQCAPMVITGRLPDGRFLADNSSFLMPGLALTSTTQRPPRPLVVIGQSACDTIGPFPGAEMRVIETRWRGRRGTQQVFVNYGQRTVSAVWDSLIAVGTERAWQIELLDEAGHVVRSLRMPWARRVTPAGLKDSLVRLQLERMHQSGREGGMVDPAESERLVREGTFVADTLPPYNDLLVGTNHKLWVVDAWAPGLGERSALAFSPSGTIEAHLTLPARYTPWAFGSDRVLTRVEDPETGIVTFRVLRMRGTDLR